MSLVKIDTLFSRAVLCLWRQFLSVPQSVSRNAGRNCIASRSCIADNAYRIAFILIFILFDATVSLAQIAASASISNSCILNNGSIDVTPTGGLPPYTYLWSTGAASEDISNLLAGTYLLTISDLLMSSDFEFEVKDDCTNDPDCSNASSYIFDSIGSKILANGLLAATCGASTSVPDSLRFTVAVADLRYQIYDASLVTPQGYHHPDWTVAKIGNVDGLEIDGFGHIYVTASSYYTSFFPFDWRYGTLGGGPNDLGAAGTIYKIDAYTGEPSVFAQLPQLPIDLLSYSVVPPLGLSSRITGPGLGNITHNLQTGNFYVSNLEDGRIYRLSVNGELLGVFDPKSPDDGLPGFTKENELVYGLDIFGSRLYYLMRSSNAKKVVVRSVALNPSGSFIPSSDQVEVNETWSTADVGLYKLVPHDISFAPDGRMAIGTRTYANNILEVYTHSSYNSVYVYSGGAWVREKAYGPGTAYLGSVVGGGESYGGVAWGPYQMGPNQRDILWSSSGDILTDEHGIIGIAFDELPLDFAVGNDSLSYISCEYIPGGGDLKGIGGDVEIWNDAHQNCGVSAQSDTFFIPAITTLNENLVANDFDLNGQPLFAFTHACGPYHGSLVLNNSGTFSYLPNPGFMGVDSFCYVSCNSVLICDQAMVYINVTGPNPLAVDDIESTFEDSAKLLQLHTNDIGADLAPGSLTLIDSPAPAEATLVNNSDGSVLFIPAPDYNGLVLFEYEISGLGGGRDTALVQVLVVPVSDPPVAVDDIYPGMDSLAVLLDPLANDYDVDGDLLPGSLVLLNGLPAFQGTLYIAGTTYEFLPVLGYCGPVNPISYQIADAEGNLDTGTIFINLNCYNVLPFAVDDTVEVCAYGTLVLDVLANDTDLDGSLDSGSLSIISAPSFGTAEVNLDGTISYTNTGFGGAEDSFIYRILDDVGGVAEAQVVIGIQGPQIASVTPIDVTGCNTHDGGLTIDLVNGGAGLSPPYSVLINHVHSAGPFGSEPIIALGAPGGVVATSVIVYDAMGCSDTLLGTFPIGLPPPPVIEAVAFDSAGCGETEGTVLIKLDTSSIGSPPYVLVLFPGTIAIGPVAGGVDTLEIPVPIGAYNRFKLLDSKACSYRYDSPFLISAADCLVCPHPENRAAIVNSSFDANIYWSPVAEAIAYKIRVRPFGAPLWTIVTTTPDTIRALTQLNVSTTYEWQVRSICDSAFLSSWSPYETFVTPSILLPKLDEPVSRAVVLSPNPAKKYTSVSIDSEITESANVLVCNELGEVVSNKEVNLQKGENRFSLSIKDFAPGFYYVVLKGNSSHSEPLKWAKLIVIE